LKQIINQLVLGRVEHDHQKSGASSAYTISYSLYVVKYN